ncbi:MAG: hypothetical protein BWY89_00015 [Bacteroidetes bacterium ADurb.BinA012]|nr:MAG: hypothetical protein BWY89_00015 [Bacteroidetes bacterium ADurb.BinA012]
MQKDKLSINLAPGMERAEVIIREVDSVNELAVKPPVKIKIEGTLGAPLEFLSKRNDQEDQINQKRCNILVDREEITISLTTNEHDEYTKGSVKGKLEFHPKFVEFGINTGKVWTPAELGLFFKMNRAFFATREDNMKLVTTLLNFTATINNKIDRAMNENGSKTDNFEQVVNSNLPKSFSLVMPIFKGDKAESIEVETFAKIDGRQVAFTLISPGAQATMEEVRDKAIDEQLEQIRAICPEIAIIEV